MNTESSLYNSLAQVEHANARLRELDFSSAMHNLLSVILDHNKEDVAGIRLLHRHNEIDPSEIMVEQEEELGGTPCLTTAATKIHAVESAFVAPNSWTVIEGVPAALEYTRDDVVVGSAEVVLSDRAFFADFGAVTDEYGMGRLLGPCIFPRSFFQRKTGDHILVETTDDVRRANILRYVNKDAYPQKRLVATSWIANRDSKRAVGTLSMLVGCELQNCVTHTACVVDAQGNHSEQSHHSSQHVPVPD